LATVGRTLGSALFVALALALFCGVWLIGRLGIGTAIDPASLTDVERQLAERMRDVTLIRSFTAAGREDRAPPSGGRRAELRGSRRPAKGPSGRAGSRRRRHRSHCRRSLS